MGFRLVKWTVILISLLFWLLVSLANQGERIVFKLVPNSIVKMTSALFTSSALSG